MWLTAVPGVVGVRVCSSRLWNQRAGPQALVGARDDRRRARVGHELGVLFERLAGEALDLRARGARDDRFDRAQRRGRPVLRGAAEGQLVGVAVGDVLEDRRRRFGRALEEFVVAALPDQPVDGRRAALHGRAAHDDRAVGQQRGQGERVEVGRAALREDRAVAQREGRGAVLGRLDRGAVAQEVPVGVDFILVDERRPLARDEAADVLQLGQARARRERRLVIGEDVRIQHPAGEHRHDQDARDTRGAVAAPAAPQHPAAGQRGREQRRRGERERLAGHPRGAPREVDDAAADQRDRHVERQPELAPADAQEQRRGGREERDADPQRAFERRRGDAEVPHRPDAGELEAAQGMDQVAEFDRRGLAAREQLVDQVALIAQEAREDHPHRDDERRGQHREPGERRKARPRPVRAARPPQPGHGDREERRDDPAGRSHTERLDQRARRDRERDQGAPARRTLREQDRRKGGPERQQERRGHLLDPAPQAVAVEQRGLGGREGQEGPQAGR